MPKVNFFSKQVVHEWTHQRLEVPQEVIDEGQDAIGDYIREHYEGADFVDTVESEVTEDLLELEVGEVV